MSELARSNEMKRNVAYTVKSYESSFRHKKATLEEPVEDIGLHLNQILTGLYQEEQQKPVKKLLSNSQEPKQQLIKRRNQDSRSPVRQEKLITSNNESPVNLRITATKKDMISLSHSKKTFKA